MLIATVIGGATAFGLTRLLNRAQYEATAIVSMGPSPSGVSSASGPGFPMLAASAEAQLIPTLSTSQVVRRAVPGISSQSLADNVSSTASVDGELLFITARRPDPASATRLANAIATVFIDQEKGRLENRYLILHSDVVAQERQLSNHIIASGVRGPARSWLQAQYADTLSRLYQRDVDARTEATIQERSLQVAQSARNVTIIRKSALANAGIGAALALLLALIFAYVMTGSYGEAAQSEAARPVVSTSPARSETKTGQEVRS